MEYLKLTSTAEIMPWVGLYICLPSVICTLAMAADLFQGFRQRKLWFPCKFFTLNAASITLIAIAMKLPVDLNMDLSNRHDMDAKLVSMSFSVTMLANFSPSLGLMNDKELSANMLALLILMLTVLVNMDIQFSSGLEGTVIWDWESIRETCYLSVLGVALGTYIVSAFKRDLQHRYKELHRLASNHQAINFSYKRLVRYVKKYWMMVETGNPQLAIACSPVSSVLGVVCSFHACISAINLIDRFLDKSNFQNAKSDYKWSISAIVILQSVGVIIGSIAPIFRCLTFFSHFDPSKKWFKHHLNVFRFKKYWSQMFMLGITRHVPPHIPGRLCQKVFHRIRNMIIRISIGLMIEVGIICSIISVITRSFLMLFSYCYYFGKSSLKRFKEDTNTSNITVVSDMEEYVGYVLQIELDANVSKRIIGNALNSITRLFHESEEKQPTNLLKLLKKSAGFNGVVEFDNDQVPPLYPEETQNCWSLVAVTLTAIALALPNISKGHITGLLISMREGLQFVRHIEECLNANYEMVMARKAASRVWIDVEVYCSWLPLDLQKKARSGKTSEEILQWLGDEAVKIVIQLKRCQDGSLDHSVSNFVAASSMYRISQTILHRCHEQQNWPTDEELFELILTIIADILCACFTNLPRVITMKCHDDAIEKREESIRMAAQLLGRSKKILKILKVRQLPNLDMDSMGYIDKWHALPEV